MPTPSRTPRALGRALVPVLTVNVLSRPDDVARTIIAAARATA